MSADNRGSAPHPGSPQALRRGLRHGQGRAPGAALPTALQQDGGRGAGRRARPRGGARGTPSGGCRRREAAGPPAEAYAMTAQRRREAAPGPAASRPGAGQARRREGPPRRPPRTQRGAMAAAPPHTKGRGPRPRAGRGRARHAGSRHPPPGAPAPGPRPGPAGTRSPHGAAPGPPAARRPAGPKQPCGPLGRAARRESEFQRGCGSALAAGGHSRPEHPGGRASARRTPGGVVRTPPRPSDSRPPALPSARAAASRAGARPPAALRAAEGRLRASLPRRDGRQTGAGPRGALCLLRRLPGAAVSPLWRGRRPGGARSRCGPPRAVLTPTAQRPRSSAAMSSTAPHVGTNPASRESAGRGRACAQSRPVRMRA